MGDIKLFEFDQFGDVRVVMIDGEPRFCAIDLCKALGLSNTTRALESLDNSDTRIMHTGKRVDMMRKLRFVSEAGMYGLIFKSKKDIAKKFQRVVTKIILPKIRKTGSFGAPKTPKFMQRARANILNVPVTMFSVIQQTYLTLHSYLEKIGYVIPDTGVDGKAMCPDIPIGRGFVIYLDQKGYEYTKQTYMHKYDDGRTVEARMYPNRMLGFFMTFLFEVWVPEHADKYFYKKVNKILPQHLTGRDPGFFNEGGIQVIGDSSSNTDIKNLN